MFRMGLGWDAHVFGGSGPVVLGGVAIPCETGLEGHSDADALVHAVCDALLGAAGLPDLGTHFPDTDPSLEGIVSLRLLKEVAGMIGNRGFDIVNVDSVIIAGKPRLSEFLGEMKENIAAVLGLDPSLVGVKASSPEGMGAVGRGEGIAAQAVACLKARGRETA